MVPSSLSAVLSFLLLLAPGIVWELQRSRYQTAVKETTLIEASRIVLASLTATGAASVAMSWVWLRLYQSARTENFESPVSSIPYIGAAIATSGVACALVLGLSWVRWSGRRPITGTRVWERAFVGLRPHRDTPPMLTVVLHNGTIWQGKFAAFDSDPEDAHRNLALEPPLRRRSPEESGGFKVVRQVGLVTLPESSVLSIEVIYVKPE
ncbi:DUF6338 family protein [Promicromonospora sp. Populi]|uniref:DUF6338 family protein n=1 Tax=Promicromonospora sp. Populi TaxID=3239420 RepID=UPI0034E2AF37